MYLEEYKSKMKKKLFEYDISNGLESVYNTSGRKIISMKNLSPTSYPCLSPRDPYYIWEMSYGITSLGVIDGHVYYTRSTAFFYDGKLIGAVSGGKKKFLNFASKVLIFPDNKCFDTQTMTLTNLSSSVETNIAFINSDLGVHAIKSENSSVNLANTFYAGQGILISGSGNSIVDGYHYITGVDKNSGLLYFNNYEFGSASIASVKCVITNEVPSMDSVCICHSRVWGVKGNKIYASKVDDPKAFCAFGRDEKDSYKYEYCDTDAFTYIAEYGGSPVVFSSSAIYKIYGDNANNYELDILSKSGGILAEDIGSVAEIDGELYYISHGRPVKFTGVKSVYIKSFPVGDVSKGVGAAKRGVYYLSCTDEYLDNRFFIYDTDSDSWYEQDALWISGFVAIDGNLYGLSSNEAYLLDFDKDAPTDTSHEGMVDSELVLDDVYDIGNMLYPARIIVRAQLGFGANISFEICYDGNLEWESINEIVGDGEGVYSILIPPKKCSSFKLRVKGKGYYCIKNIAVECGF